MFTTQAARQIDAVTAPPTSPTWFKRWLDQFRPVMRTLVGNCAQPLEHRGPVTIRNTHTDVEVPPEGEPGLTICTSRANDQLPDPPPVALFVECGESVFQDVHIEGDLIVDGPTIHNDCVIFNSGAIFNGPVAGRRPGYSSTTVRFCLTSTFDSGTQCATARVFHHADSGGCYPTYGSAAAGTCPSAMEEITVVDRSGRWTSCAQVGDCGYAAYFSDTSATSECELTCSEAGTGVYEVVSLSPGSEYNICTLDVVTKVCCIAGSLVVCKTKMYFSMPIKTVDLSCEGGGTAVCT